LFAGISAALKGKTIQGASAIENATLSAVQELTAEIRAMREVYMVVVRSFPDPFRT
jgi:hypothetical protein